MTQKYQNEKTPILNGQKKSKTSEKVQMRDLEGPTSFHPYDNALCMSMSSQVPISNEISPLCRYLHKDKRMCR